MTKIGIRALKDGLSRHIRAVQSGETVLITDHGKAVARLIPETADFEDERVKWASLALKGLVEMPVTPLTASRSKGPKIKGRSVASIITGQRR